VELLTSILAGIAGTLAMTSFAEILAHLLKRPYFVVIILATMLPFNRDLTPPKASIYIAATILHYAIGVGFAYAYLRLMQEGVITNDTLTALLYGAAIGIIAIIGWRLFFTIHPNPPRIKPTYFAMIWLGHVVLSVIAAGVFKLNPLAMR
jgi:hypothetical protein